MTTVLIVDDEIDMRMLIRLAIEMADAGLEVVGEAQNGTEAIEVWRGLAGASVPDVIVLDNRMPGLSGLEVAERILAERPGQQIILYTTALNDGLIRAARGIGIARCLSKNDAGKLAEVVQQLGLPPKPWRVADS